MIVLAVKEIAGLYTHLLQSTLFAGIAWLLTLALRKNPARVRHGVLFIASIKFLIPFSALVGLGTVIPGHTSAPPIPSTWVTTVSQISQPLATLPVVATHASGRDYLTPGAMVVWACGFAAITIVWLRRWKRVHALRNSSTPAGIAFAVPVMYAPDLIEPGVVGIMSPILLLPEGIENRLEPAQLDAILAHELCHVRHRDNLTATLHMAVQTIFWFHPLIWWLGTRLVEERERACDEEVLRLGIRPQVYAKGILNVCRLYVESPLACVSGVTGSNLKKRIEAIMKNRTVLRMNLVRKLALATLAITAVTLPITLGVFSTAPVRAQAPAPAFDAASVKPMDPNLRVGMDFRITGGRLVSTNWTLELLMREAYSVRYYQIFGGPSWLRDDKFNIEATAGQHNLIAMDPTNGEIKSLAPAPGYPTRDQMLAMLRTLLEDRFKLKVHREMREGNVYVLTLAKGGHKLKPTENEARRPMISTLRNTPVNLPGVSYTGVGQNATLAQLVEHLSNVVQAPVSDETGITGNFDFRFDYATLDAPPDSGPSIFASVQDQLGLKLEARKGQVEVLVIDHAEKPSEN